MADETIVQTAEKAVTKKKATVKKTAEAETTTEPTQTIKDTDNVVVRNGFRGILVWINPRTGENFIWDEPDSEQDMKVSDLRTMKQNSKAFFENNWVIIDDNAVMEYLGVGGYYSGIMNIDSFDKLLHSSVAEIKSKVSKLKDGQKTTLIARVRGAVKSGELDSLKIITAFEDCLNIQLIDR